MLLKLTNLYSITTTTQLWTPSQVKFFLDLSAFANIKKFNLSIPNSTETKRSAKNFGQTNEKVRSHRQQSCNTKHNQQNLIARSLRIRYIFALPFKDGKTTQRMHCH